MSIAAEVSVDTVLGLVAILAGLVALGVAWKTDKRVRETSEKLTVAAGQLEGVKDDLGQVEQGLSTHWIGEFPAFLGHVNDVLKSAEESIIVFCDLPAYGVYSGPDAWWEYREILNAKGGKRDFDLHVMCLESPERKKMHEEQFPDDTWDSTDARLERFYRDHPREDVASSQGETTSDREHFLGRLEKVQQEEEKYLGATPINAIMPLYFWVADGKESDDEKGVSQRPEAVFALTKFTEDAREIGFRTRDERLIVALRGIYGRYKELADQQLQEKGH
jgi:hypothetical protein